MVINKASQNSLKKAVKLLQDKNIIIAPGDTIYGILGAFPYTEASIRTLKGRDEQKPFIVLAQSAAAAADICGGRIDTELAGYWPAPLTLILPMSSGGSIGIRVPNDPFLLNLLQETGLPLYSTSVNRSGKQPMSHIDRIIREFEGDVALIIDGGDMPRREASTIIDARKKPYTILRQGSLRVPLE